MAFNLDCQRQKDFIRYIKHSETDAMKEFDNEEMRMLLKFIAIKLGLVTSNGDVKYSFVKKYIIEFARTRYNNINISKKQIDKLLNPRKDVCSKFAPVIAMAIFDIIANLLPEGLPEEINTKYPVRIDYPEFIFGDILDIIRPADDKLVQHFNRCLSNIRRILQNSFQDELFNLYN